MTSKITIFDHFCKKLVDFSNIPTTPRSWILNGYGKAEFSIGFDPTRPQSEQLLQKRYFEFGNLVHIEHIPQVDASGNQRGTLPTWTGIILPNRDWDDGVCHITAYSAEAILAFRAMPYLSVKTTPKNIIRQMINIVHERASNIKFQAGQLDDLPSTFADDLRTNAYDHIQKLIKTSGMDWNVTGDINAKDELDLFINLYARKGFDTNLDFTNRNSELDSPLLSEQGTPSNQVFGYSQAQTANSRYNAEAIHQEALNDYGPLQLNQVFVGMHDYASVKNATYARAQGRGRPLLVVKRTAIDIDRTLDYMDTGNTVGIQDARVGFNPDGGYGFSARAKILSVTYNDLSNRLPLAIEVI